MNNPEDKDKSDLGKLSGLFQFAAGILDARSRTRLRVDSERLGCFREADLRGIPGLSIASESRELPEQAWLSLDRLKISPPPLPDEESQLYRWIDQETVKSPASTPAFEEIVVFQTNFEEAKTLLSNGSLLQQDLTLLELDEEEPNVVDQESDSSPEISDDSPVRVVLRITHNPDILQQLEHWRANDWADWVKTETPVRKSVSLYKKLFKLHTVLHSGDSSANELVWGYGMAEFGKAGGSKRIDIPLVEFLLDIDLKENGALTITQRDVPPYLNLRPLMEAGLDGAEPAQAKLQRQFEELKQSDETELTPFIHDELDLFFLSVTGQISSDAEYMDRQRVEATYTSHSLPGRDPEKLRVQASWVIYGRPRSTNYRIEDLNEMKNRLMGLDASQLPASLCGFFQPLPESDDPSETIREASGPTYPNDWGDYVRQNNAASRSQYKFPLASNEDQNQIVKQLEKYPVVTVTGPPGTGKTHSIANIVAHYMATGKRVLVTARTAEAIAAVQSKLPEELASLVIASVASDREGTRQLESAIQRLSDEVVHLREEQLEADKDAATRAIDAAETEIIECEINLARISQRNLTPLKWQGAEITVMALAEKLDHLSAEYDWFEDRPSRVIPTELPFSIRLIADTIAQHSNYIGYAFEHLPLHEELPSTTELIDYHKNYLAAANEPEEDLSNQPTMAVDSPEAVQKAEELESRLSQAEAKFSRLEPWQHRLISEMVSQELRAGDTTSHEGRNNHNDTESVIVELVKLTGGRTPPLVVIDHDQVEYEKLVETIGYRQSGKNSSLAVKVINRKVNKVVDSVLVNGLPPSSATDWQHVLDWLKIDLVSNDIRRLWSPLESEDRLPAAPYATHELAEAIANFDNLHQKAKSALSKITSWVTEYEVLFPIGIDSRQLFERLEFNLLGRAIRANLEKEKQSSSVEVVMTGFVEQGCQKFSKVCKKILDALHDSNTDPNDIIALRNELTVELDNVLKIRADLDSFSQQLKLLEESGVPLFAAKLRELCLGSTVSAASAISTTFIAEHDGAVGYDVNGTSLSAIDWQETWQAAWEWAASKCELDEILALGNGDEWRERKQKMVRQRERQFLRLIQAETRLGLKERITPTVRSEFMRFTQAMGKLGAGTGKSAHRHRKTIREAARNASSAVPVWIMPENKVSEQLPPDLGKFDLVILDEASQSDITSIGILARGKKLLIVGDEKQVSPSAVGVTTDRVDQLRAECLQNLPNKSSYDEKTSIFDIAMLRNPQSHLMLKEHFRCVHPIIEFSTHFYEGRLVPLRVAKASERFDPPLVDVYIKGATRNGKINEAEANYIVEEIAAITANPDHHQRDIGVISLIGGEQAEHIERLLMEDSRIGPEIINRHQIICGDSRTMQGQERSVVFLSMVADPGSARMQNTREDQQRFNVAMSRARDREYVIRSVSSDDLKTGDLKHKVIQHMKEPLPEGHTVVGQDVLARCESGFETDVCQRLLDAGYRVQAQVAAGYYRIDLVVEGENDTRLAIELDGDHWHGPDQWEKDAIRQTALERAGWSFWRVYGSQWNHNKEYFWQLLQDALSEHHIAPIGGEAATENFTEYRSIDILEHSYLSTSVIAETADPADETGVMDVPLKGDKPTEATEAEPLVISPENIAAPAADVTVKSHSAPSPVLPTDATMPAAFAEANDRETGLTINPETQTRTVTPADESETSVKLGQTVNMLSSNPLQSASYDGERFYEPDYQQELSELCLGIIDELGPINFEDLAVRIARLHNFSRTGRRIQDGVFGAIEGRRELTTHKGQPRVLWPKNREPVPVIGFRGVELGGMARDWDQLPWPEKVGLAQNALAKMPADPTTAIMQSLAITRAGKLLRADFENAVKAARACDVPFY